MDKEKETVSKLEETIQEMVEDTGKTETKKSEKEKIKKEKKSPEKEELKKLQADYQEQQDQFLRLRAEYDNFRKRSISEKNALYNNAVSDAVKAILPVADNIGRALEQENASAKDLKKGLEMIAAQFRSSFEQLGVKEIGEAGETFDPTVHNAVSHIEDDQLGENVISAVLQKGYVLGEHVIRHAMVQVAN